MNTPAEPTFEEWADSAVARWLERSRQAERTRPVLMAILGFWVFVPTASGVLLAGLGLALGAWSDHARLLGVVLAVVGAGAVAFGGLTGVVLYHLASWQLRSLTADRALLVTGRVTSRQRIRSKARVWRTTIAVERAYDLCSDGRLVARPDPPSHVVLWSRYQMGSPLDAGEPCHALVPPGGWNGIVTRLDEQAPPDQNSMTRLTRAGVDGESATSSS